MENGYVRALDEYFAAQYSDYVKLSALDGYVMPEVVFDEGDPAVHDQLFGELMKARLSVSSLSISP